jgi:hypothetical protein
MSHLDRDEYRGLVSSYVPEPARGLILTHDEGQRIQLRAQLERIATLEAQRDGSELVRELGHLVGMHGQPLREVLDEVKRLVELGHVADREASAVDVFYPNAADDAARRARATQLAEERGDYERDAQKDEVR